MQFCRVLVAVAVLFGGANSQKCAEDEFTCEANGACIPSIFVCDGISDCQNSTDEEDCPSTTSTECPGFICPNSGICVPPSWLCDGDNDCGDMSDEQDCPSTTSTQCSGFTCNDGECLPGYWQCDAEPDCDGGEDEAGCPCQGFECPSGLCIPSGWTCDGDNDCGDFSDETEEACPCDEDEERCPPPSEQEGVVGGCIRPEYICDSDGIWDCPDGSDQTNCTNQPEDVNSPPSPDQIKRRPETVRASLIRRVSKKNEKKAYELKHAEKRQSLFYKNRSPKRGKQ